VQPLATLASVARLHIVAIGALGTLTFGFVLTGERPWLLAALCACDWFVVNLLNRMVDLREDAANGIRGVELVARHRRAVLAVGFGALALSLALTAWLVPGLLLWRAAFHGLGFAYNWPLLPVVGRIKQRYFWKNTASATGFLITCFAYPLSTSSARTADLGAKGVAALALFFFLFELSYEVVYDLRDLEGDQQAGVRSYPAVHGRSAGVAIAALLMTSSWVVMVSAFFGALVPWRAAVMGAAPLLQLALFARAVRRGGPTTADCVGVTWFGALLLAGYHVWEALGLPGAR
jgi:4-hydroxybenzoate polyprenyltransferase